MRSDRDTGGRREAHLAPGGWAVGGRARRRLVAASALTVVVSSLGVASAVARSSGERLEGGTSLHGVDLGGAREGETWASTRVLAESWLETPVTLVVGELVLHRTRRELGATIDLDRTRARLVASGGGAHELVTGLDEAAASALVASLREGFDLAPALAHVDARSGRAVPAREGRAISSMQAVEAIRAAIAAGEVVVTLPTRTLAVPEEAVVPIGRALYTHTLSSWTTRFAQSEEQWGRLRNIVTSAAALDGSIIPPRGEISFNAIVGERTIDRGYRPADEVVDGRLVDGIGGGVCQVAATLHAAAFTAGLDILEHHPHTRGSSYIELGLDAAVSWPSVDLRIRNPFAFPVRVRAQTQRGVLTIGLLGAAAAPEVEWAAEVVERIPRGAERAPELARDGEPPRDDDGVDGLVVRRERTVRAGGRVTREVRTLRYPAVAALVDAPVPEEPAP